MRGLFYDYEQENICICCVSIIFILLLYVAGCNLAGSAKTITIQITNNRDTAIRFLLGGSDYLILNDYDENVPPDPPLILIPPIRLW